MMINLLDPKVVIPQVRLMIRIGQQIQELQEGVAQELAGLNVLAGKAALIYARDVMQGAIDEIDELLSQEDDDDGD